MCGRSATGSATSAYLLPAAIGRAAAGCVLVEALRQVQALEHELDRAGRGRRALVAAGEVAHDGLQPGHVAEERDVVRRRDVVTRVHDSPRLEGREHVAHPLGAALLLEDREDGGLQQAVDDLAVAAVL